MRTSPTCPSRARLFAAIALALGFAVLAATLSAGDQSTPALQKGRSLYSQYCRSCHGVTGNGDGPTATSLKIPPADLTSIGKKYNGFPEEKVTDWIDGTKYAVGHGSREMPVWGKKFGHGQGGSGVSAEVQALTAYIKSIQK